MATAALILVTAVWGITFVQVKDAVELYPFLAFLAIRYLIATAALAPIAVRRLGGFGREGLVAGAVLGGLIALGIGLQTAGLERTTVTSTGFITGLYVLFTPCSGWRSSGRRSRARSGPESPSRSSASPCCPVSRRARGGETCSCSSARSSRPSTS